MIELEHPGLQCFICGGMIIPPRPDIPQVDYLQCLSPKGEEERTWACHEHLERAPCVISGCRRHFKGRWPQEFICAAHWREIPKPRKKIYFLTRRRLKRLEGSEAHADEIERLENVNYIT